MELAAHTYSVRGGKFPVSRKGWFGVTLLKFARLSACLFPIWTRHRYLVEYETLLNFVRPKIRSSDGVGFDMKYVDKLFGVP